MSYSPPPDWPFADPPNVAVITTRQIVPGGGPILYVYHNAEDGAWQFHGAAAPSEADATVVGLDEVMALDASVGELAHLPLGWQAERTAVGEPWRWFAQPVED